jgi:hypothetical protein
MAYVLKQLSEALQDITARGAWSGHWMSMSLQMHICGHVRKRTPAREMRLIRHVSDSVIRDMPYKGIIISPSERYDFGDKIGRPFLALLYR